LRKLLFLALACAAAPFGAAAIELSPDPDGPPVDVRTPDQIERDRLARFKFEPITGLAPSGRTLRRVTFQDIYGSPFAPGIVFEKAASGEVRMTVISNDAKQIDQAVLKPEAWAYLTKEDAFALPRQKPRTAATEICHGTEVVVEGAQARKATRYHAAVCNGQADVPALLVGRRLARVAVDAIPRCASYREFAREPAWTLTQCLKETSPDKRPRKGDEEYSVFGAKENPSGAVTNFIVSTSTEYLGKATRQEAAAH